MSQELLPWWWVDVPVKSRAENVKQRTIIGWREWVALPELGVEAIKAKIDTGAATSALHVSNLSSEQQNGRTWLSFDVHPIQRSDQPLVRAGAWLVDERPVRNTSGRSEIRPVIEADVLLGDHRFAAQITLTRRDEMGFRMLLGRRSLRRRFLVDSGRSFLHELEES